jgi:hypothetical protein
VISDLAIGFLGVSFSGFSMLVLSFRPTAIAAARTGRECGDCVRGRSGETSFTLCKRYFSSPTHPSSSEAFAECAIPIV